VTDIFDLQSRITARVVGEIAPRIERAEIERATQKPTSHLDAYDYYMRGLSAVHKWTREDNATAIEMFGEAVKHDPEFAAAYGMAIRAYSQRRACGWIADEEAEAETVRSLAARATATGPNDAIALSTTGIGLAFVCRELEEGAALIARALELNPNLAMAWGFSGWVKSWAGDTEGAISDVETAIRLNPLDPRTALSHGAIACALFFACRDGDAIRWAESSIRLRRTYQVVRFIHAAALAHSGRMAEARRAVDGIRNDDPGLRISSLIQSFPFGRAQDAARMAEGLRMAGMPD
jgi:tetratricopeptide (TPR) repeat protein